MKIQRTSLVTLFLVTALTLTGCSGLGTVVGEDGQTAGIDSVSSATKDSGEKKEVANIWKVLDEDAVKKLFEDDTLRGVFLWSNARENLVVADPAGIKLPFVWPDSQNSVSTKTLGYPLVTASPKALVKAEPDFILLMMPKADVERLEAVKEELKNTLSGKALAKVKRDHFYVWLYESKSK